MTDVIGFTAAGVLVAVYVVSMGLAIHWCAQATADMAEAIRKHPVD